MTDEERPLTKRDLDQAIDRLTASMQEFVRDSQTEILRAFHSFEQNRELRFSRLKADVTNLDQEASGRMLNIEKRLMVIEERLLLNPPRHQ